MKPHRARAATPPIRALWVLLLLGAMTAAARAGEETLEFRAPGAAGDSTTPAVMRDLAERLLPVYQESDRDRYLANLSALQMAAGDFEAADATRRELSKRRPSADSSRPVGRAVVYDLYVHARAEESQSGGSFAAGLTKAFHEVVSHLDDAQAYAVTQWLETPPATFRNALQRAFDQQRPKDTIGESQALDLIWKYVAYDTYRALEPLAASLAGADDEARYSVDRDVLIETRSGVRLHALLVRPKGATQALPTLLEFTIYDGDGFAKECAAHGYVGVVAYSRGTHDTPRRVVPFQHDGEDARAVIDWIAKQPWSDGRVAMYGEGYSAFTSWAAAERAPPALKAIAAGASTAPGIDLPMEGNIFQNSAYRWSLRVTDPKLPFGDVYGEDAPWRALNQKWYRSGRPYRDFARIAGHRDPVFMRWLDHPSYDRFWQKMIPYRREFAHVDIPVLTMTGYFAVNEPGDLYYFTEHTRFNPHAEHTLLIGPYDDAAMRRAPALALHGYELDPAARIDLHELRYAWFDHILKGAAAPELLHERVNYQVMGTNEWRHADSIGAMADGSLRFFLDAAASSEGHRLSPRRNPKAAFVRQSVSFLDRTDAAWTPPSELISRRLVAHNGLIFVSEPFAKTSEFSGFLSGRLDLALNKMDVDLNIMLYEKLASGDYVRLFNPAYEFRASYVRGRAHRRLLRAGERQQLAFRSERMTGRLIQAGSRLVVVLSVGKRPDREINYGTGSNVSEESIADGKTALKIRWFNDSYIEIPIRR